MLAYGVLWALTLAVMALVLTLPDGGPIARGVLCLALSATGNPAPSVAGVLAVAINNCLHAGWPLALGPLGATRRPVTRKLADVAVALNVLVCAALTGAALGGYAPRIVVFLPHLPLEWAGIAVGAAGWLVERRRPLTARERARCACALILLLLAAAIVEIYATPHA